MIAYCASVKPARQCVRVRRVRVWHGGVCGSVRGARAAKYASTVCPYYPDNEINATRSFIPYRDPERVTCGVRACKRVLFMSVRSATSR